MIKRRFYREEHGDRDEPSSGSSSSSSDDDDNDSEAEADATEESDHNAEVAEVKEHEESSSSSDSSAEEIDNDSSGFANDDDGTESLRKIRVGSQLSGKHAITGIVKREKHGVAERESKPTNMEDFVLKLKSVYKCRICPRIICLTEETMKTHLNSKRHTRSEKLLKENRLKAMLNSDGEIENQETPAEMHARVMALAQNKVKKKNKGRQRQKKRSIKKKGDASYTDKKAKKGDSSNKDKKAKVQMKTQAKKRRKTGD